MAATTISLSALTDDTGSAAAPNGDGTILNNAWFQSTLCAAINACWSSQFEIGGRFTADGFGTHTFSAGGTGGQVISVRNTTAGTGNYAAVYVGNDGSATNFYMQSFSSTFTTSGSSVADGGSLIAERAGGLSIGAVHASGTIRFYAGGTTLRGTITTAGLISWATGGEHKITASTAAASGFEVENTSTNASAYAHMRVKDGGGHYYYTRIVDDTGSGVIVGDITIASGTTNIVCTSTSGLQWCADGYVFKLKTSGYMYLENGSRLSVGSASHVGRTVTNVTNGINIYDGTAPSGTMANGATLYSTAGELKVMDAAGNATTLSPHEGTDRWIFKSVNTVTGKGIRVEMERLMRRLNEMLGGGYLEDIA